MNKSPVLFLVFNRVDTMKKVFDSIRSYQPDRLYIAADGPRKEKPGETEVCSEVREFITGAIDWPCEVKTLFREDNLGCKNAVSSAITWFFDNEEEGIILEDDCLPHPDFFIFCDTLLEYHRNNEQVMIISGNNFQDGKKWGEASYYYSRFSHIWGWAGWRRAWKKYSTEMEQLEAFGRDHVIYNLFGHRRIEKYFLNKFRLVRNNQINTWDYQWQYTVWANGGLSILPNMNLVQNIGIGEANATHTSKFSSADSSATSSLGSLTHPLFQVSELDADLHTAFSQFVFSLKKVRRMLNNLYLRQVLVHIQSKKN
jgi:hypothetical protein